MSDTLMEKMLGLPETYEAGASEPTLSILIALADYFDVSLDYLVGRSDIKERR